MINNSAMRDYIHSLNYRTSKDAAEILERRVKEILTDACEFAREDRRQTIISFDIERAVKYQGKK